MDCNLTNCDTKGFGITLQPFQHSNPQHPNKITTSHLGPSGLLASTIFPSHVNGRTRVLEDFFRLTTSANQQTYRSWRRFLCEASNRGPPKKELFLKNLYLLHKREREQAENHMDDRNRRNMKFCDVW